MLTKSFIDNVYLTNFSISKIRDYSLTVINTNYSQTIIFVSAIVPSSFFYDISLTVNNLNNDTSISQKLRQKFQEIFVQTSCNLPSKLRGFDCCIFIISNIIIVYTLIYFILIFILISVYCFLAYLGI